MPDALTPELAVAAGFVVTVVRKLRPKRKAPSNPAGSDVPRAIARDIEIGSVCSEWRAETDAHRVMLLSAHNGGQPVENPGAQLYITAAAEGVGEDTSRISSEWIKRPLTDDWYRLLLWRVWKEKTVDVSTADIPATAELRQAFDHEGVARAVFCECLAAPGHYWYVAATFRDDNPTTPARVVALAHRVRPLLETPL